MPDRTAKQVSVRCPAQIARLVHASRRVFTGIDRLTAFPAGADLVLNSVHAGAIFLLIVERGDHDMPPFPPPRVITVVTDDEALDVVVFGVYARHSQTVTPAIGIIIRKNPAGATP
jgi:hypothetical protein